MRRLALISGMLLTLTAGVWTSALSSVASNWCMHDMSASVAAAPSPDEHDCCRAKLDEPDTTHSEPARHPHTATAATHEHAPSPETQAARTHEKHEKMDCAGAREPESEQNATAAFGERGRSCFECCAGRTGQMPTTAAFGAPEQNRLKRAAAHASVCARASFVTDAHGVSHLAPSQHAPPASHERRHMLINVFLI